jgi:acyl carrier protein
VPDSVETAARTALAEVLPGGVAPDAIALDARFDRLGLTSLNKVLFLTSVCERTNVGLHHFTEDDVAGMRTLGQVVTALSRHTERA